MLPIGAAQFALISACCSFLTFGIYTAFLVAIFIAVRPKRPDATTMLVVSAMIFLISFVARWGLSSLLPLLEGSFIEATGMNVYPAVDMLLGTIANVLAMLCLIVGVVRLARPLDEQPPLHLPPGA